MGGAVWMTNGGIEWDLIAAISPSIVSSVLSTRILYTPYALEGEGGSIIQHREAVSPPC